MNNKDEYGDIIQLIRKADFSKGSGHKKRFRDKLFSIEAGNSDRELGLDEMSNVRAAVRSDTGINVTKRSS